jgi:phosphoribosylformylglycinamidine synthase
MEIMAVIPETAKDHGFTETEYRELCRQLGREPNRVELGIYSLNWSEHCSYKSSKHLLNRLPTGGERVLQGPGENAGLLRLDDELCCSIKVESHNHPSAVEPHSGAATGIGGIVRDILAMGTRPIALLDSLRFGELDSRRSRRLLDGVVEGIAFYGNCIGVPTVGGEVYFDESYEDNCLVNVMCVGLARIDQVKRSIVKGVGNPVILVGARTGRDGIHGATFASEDLTGDSQEKRPNVQIGDPFMEKLLIEATLEARAEPEVVGVQDLGAGGLSTALPEMAHKGGCGIEMRMDRIPLRAEGMSPYEIILSESQERMVFCVERWSEDKFLSIFRKWGLEAEIVGEVIEKNVYRLTLGDDVVAEIPVESLVGGVPEPPLESKRPAFLDDLSSAEIKLESRSNPLERLLELLGAPNVARKEWVYEQYDHMVRTDTVELPGAGDAAVLRVKGKPFGLAVTIDGNGRFVRIDPYEGGKAVVCEAARNLVSVGARPIAITDCLNFGNPNHPETYWTFEHSVQGMAEAARTLDIPFVSGNVSFYNQSETRRVCPTPTVGMLGIVETLENRVRQGFSSPGARVYLLGKSEGRFGGSEFLSLFYEVQGGQMEPVDLSMERKFSDLLLELAGDRPLASLHDVSEGGLLVSIAECCLWGGHGADLKIEDRSEPALFGEWGPRYVACPTPGREHELEDRFGERDLPFLHLGTVREEPILTLNGQSVALEDLFKAYGCSLRQRMEA